MVWVVGASHLKNTLNFFINANYNSFLWKSNINNINRLQNVLYIHWHYPLRINIFGIWLHSIIFSTAWQIS